ncbi:GNAT family N-acetyltransferase [Actinoalloteichus spitiensis]|uniref:GNAT family N-acetyltransferase n=1 Tax=Actinoalloteichus spitiensis TaxID=252394 RepID=UPI000366CD76|nr:GNAT family N-acetyltransferase [Actinoalloteichus spitiensis]
MISPVGRPPARIEPVDLASQVDEVVGLARRAMAAADQPFAEHTANYLPRVVDLPGLLALGVRERSRLVAVAVGWPCGHHPSWPAMVGPALLATGNLHWLEGSFELAELQVSPEHHGQGLGTALLRAVEESTALDRIVLQANVANRRAREFYRRRGFRVLSGPYQWLRRPRFLVLGARLPLA